MLLDADGSVIMQDTATPYYNALCGGVKTELPDYSIMESWLQPSEQAPGEALMHACTRTCFRFSVNFSLMLAGTVPTENTSLSIEAQAPMVASARAKIKTGLAAQVIVIRRSKHALVGNRSASLTRMLTRVGVVRQRERAHNMSLKELADYFHLPIADAAKRLKLCSTAIKHACRRNGVARWPSRKVNSHSIVAPFPSINSLTILYSSYLIDRSKASTGR